MGRLFGSQSEEEFEVTANQPHEEDQEIEQLEESSTSQRSTFRFPIITDAEIYGWEDEPNDLNLLTREPVPSYKDIQYTDEPTTPLYKNNRWPSEPEIGTIHRVGSQKKYQEERDVHVKPQTKRKPSVAINENEKKTGKKEEIVNQRHNKPFKPTEVPSPVYGFAQPKRPVEQVKAPSVEHELPVYNESDNPIRLSDEIMPSGRKVLLKPIVESEADELQIPTSSEKMTGVQQYDETIESEKQLQETAIEIQESPEVEESSKEYEPADLNTEVEPETEDNTNSYTVESITPKNNTQQPSTVEHTETIVESARTAVLVAEPEEESVDEIIIDDEISTTTLDNQRDETAEVLEVRKERAMPFNVVMLKSDKEREQMRKLSNMKPVPASAATLQTDSLSEVEVASADVPTSPIVTTELPDSSSQKGPSMHTKKMKPINASLSASTVGETPNHAEEEVLPHYVFPAISDLVPAETQQEDTEWLTSQSEKLVEALSHFSVEADILEAVQGPTVTRFELTVGFGTKVSKVRNLTDDLKLALAAEDIRIQAPIPGTSSIGIEIPNRTTRPVRISEVIDTEKFRSSDSPLEAVLGLSLTGEPVTIDLRKMPHGMIAGATGSGKSVCINSILVSLLYKATPTELKMMLIDPKMVELAPFNGIPHLISPVITDVKAATAALKWAVDEMERRYELFAHAGARNIERYNQMAEANRQFSLKMPYLLIVIDELADLMMVAPTDVEVSISRIAQKARACGIHLIIATQRPSVDVITGIIKANIPTRIAFAVSSQIDSRTILDGAGAERLLGKGDMLYVGNGQSSPNRLQGTFVTDDEIEEIIEHVKKEASPEYLFGQEDLLAAVVEEEETDPLFTQACSFIIEQGSASTSLLQRHFSIGYNRAAKLMDRIEAHGFISEQRGSRSRDVYATEADLDAFLNPTEDA